MKAPLRTARLNAQLDTAVTTIDSSPVCHAVTKLAAGTCSSAWSVPGSLRSTI